jgi:hypothetical protein
MSTANVSVRKRAPPTGSPRIPGSQGRRLPLLCDHLPGSTTSHTGRDERPVDMLHGCITVGARLRVSSPAFGV